MIERFAYGYVAERVGRSLPERPAGRRQDNFLDGALLLAHHALEDGRVLAVHGNQLAGSVR